MKKLLGTIAAIAVAGSAFAITHVDVDYLGYDYIGSGNGASGTFNLVNPGNDSFAGYTDLGGYNPGDDLTNVSATFWFTDDRNYDGYESVRIELGGHWPINDGGGSLNSGAGSWTTISFGVNSVDIGILESNGTLGWEVRRSWGDAYLRGAMLQGDSFPRTGGGNTGVPDSGSTLSLLGLAMIGLFTARKRLKK